jgi:stearoyl-CoA desaturase (delta-9 desaturase)
LYIHALFFIGLFIVPWEIAVIGIIVSQIIYVGFCGTSFFHRIVAHKNYINPVTEKIMIILSWVGLSGSAIAWAGTHRKHHRFSDSEKDPHCPIHQGKLKAYWYSSGSSDIVKYIPDLLRKDWYRFQHNYYFRVALLAHLLGWIFLPFTAYWLLLVVPAFLMWFAGSTINIFCHDRTGPKNLKFLGLLHAGEGWHKNHHTDPKSIDFGHRFDWGKYTYRILSWKTNEIKA